MTVNGASLTPTSPSMTAPQPDDAAIAVPPGVTVRLAEGLQGQMGLYAVTIDGATRTMTQQEVAALGESPQPATPGGSDPTQQHDGDASRAPGLLIEDKVGKPGTPQPLPLPGGHATQDNSGSPSSPPP